MYKIFVVDVKNQIYCCAVKIQKSKFIVEPYIFVLVLVLSLWLKSKQTLAIDLLILGYPESFQDFSTASRTTKRRVGVSD
jgi:hypothetical protein